MTPVVLFHVRIVNVRSGTFPVERIGFLILLYHRSFYTIYKWLKQSYQYFLFLFISTFLKQSLCWLIVLILIDWDAINNLMILKMNM